MSDSVRDVHADVPWRSMAGMRDRLIHDYFGVNLDVVWYVATSELATIATALARIAP